MLFVNSSIDQRNRFKMVAFCPCFKRTGKLKMVTFVLVLLCLVYPLMMLGLKHPTTHNHATFLAYSNNNVTHDIITRPFSDNTTTHHNITHPFSDNTTTHHNITDPFSDNTTTHHNITHPFSDNTTTHHNITHPFSDNTTTHHNITHPFSDNTTTHHNITHPFSDNTTTHHNVPHPYSNITTRYDTITNPAFNNIIGYTPDPKVQKYVVYLCDGSSQCGGWADRQKGIVAAFMLAQALGRKFRVQLTHPCDLTAHLMPRNIDWRIKPGELKGLSTTYIKDLDGMADMLRQEMVKMDIEAKYPQSVLYLTSNMEYSEYIIRNMRYEKQLFWMKRFNTRQLYAYIFDQLFQFVPNLEKKFQNFTAGIDRHNGSRLYCAQVRLGKNPTVPGDSRVINPSESVNAVWDFFSKSPGLQKNKLFVTSDSQQVHDAAKKIFHSNILETQGSIVHIEHYEKSADVCGGFSKVLIDQRVLSMCDVLVISRSGFGVIGSWFRNTTKNLYSFSEGKVRPCDPDNLESVISLW